MTLIDYQSISAQRMCTEESRTSLTGAAVPTETATVIVRPAGERKLSKLIRNAMSQEVTRNDLIQTVAQNPVGCDELMTRTARFVAAAVEK